MYIARTNSSLLLPSMQKGNKSFVRLQNAIDRAIKKRAKEWGYPIQFVYTYSSKDTFTTVYKDEFENYHSFVIEEVED